MGINIRSKSCPNCGANLKFGINDNMVICGYCGSQIEIEHQKQNVYINNLNINVKNEKVYIGGLENANVNKIYINKGGEIFKWWLKALVAINLLIWGMATLFLSTPIYGILLIIAGIITIVPLTGKWFFKTGIIKVIIVAVLSVIGILGGAMNTYKLPSQFQGKYVSETTDMTIEIKGNKIIINDNGKITEEDIYCWEETYGTISYYNIKVNNGEYKFKLQHKGDVKYKFYNVVRYGDPRDYFYNVKDADQYAHYEGDDE